MANETIGQVAYDAYVKSSGGVSLVSGAPLPEFDALPEKIKIAWEASASAVAETFY